jgi:carbon storage regulator CsrA
METQHMLVLSRRPDEKILLPTLGVTVHLIKVQGGSVKIGIEAPPEVKIHRQELLNRPILDATGVPAPAGRCRSLIVEDDSQQRELLAGLLALYGCSCDTASDGLDALAYLTTHPRPDFVLLDLLMPRCNGGQMLHQVRGDPRFEGLKVIAVSGTPPTKLGIPTGPSGVDAWIPKPVDPKTLWQTIQKNLASPLAKN